MTIHRKVLVLSLLLGCRLLSGCTFGVDAVELRAEDSVDAAGLTLFREDLSRIGDLRVTGDDGAEVRAALITRGLIAPGREEEARESLEIALYTEGAVAGVTSSVAPGPFAELLEPARLELDIPAAMDLELELGSTSAVIADVRGLITIEGTSGSVVLDGGDELDIDLQSGSLVAEARSARLRTSSGSMDLVIDEHLDADALSGSIHAQLRGGGAVRTDTGSIEITLEGPLTEDLIVSAGDGSVSIRMARGVSARLDLQTRGGSLSVSAGSFDYRGSAFVGEVGAGAHTLRVRTGDGSIAVDASEEGR